MIDQLLTELRRRHVRIWASGRQLRYDGPPEALDEDCVALLRSQRDQLLERLEATGREAPPHIRPTNRDRPLPLSSGQRRMWLNWQLAPLSPVYNVAFVVKAAGRLDSASIARALTEIRRRHEVLRTRFAETRDGVAAVVEEAIAFALPLEDVENEAEAWQRMREAARVPFDLAAQAPFEARLFRLDGARDWLFFKLHHIVADVSSISILLNELDALYADPDRVLQEPRLQYVDFSAWEQIKLRSGAGARLLEYWNSKLDGDFTPLRLSTDGRPRTASMRGDRVSFQLSYSLSARLGDLARSQQATPFMVLASAFRILLYRYTGQTDVLIGTPVVCRNEPGTEQLIGYFGNTLVLRNPLAATDSYLDVLAGERRAAIEAYEHQDLPFETLAQELAGRRPLHKNSLIQVMLSYAEESSSLPLSPALRAHVEEVETGTAKFDLLLSMQESDAGLSGVFEYAELFERETVERMTKHLERVLTAMAFECKSSIRDTMLLTPPEQELMLRTWNQTSRPIANSGCVHELFEARAQANADAVAIYFGDETITYATLNAHANCIARRLLLCGVDSEEPVAVCLPRSPRLIATLIGVLKAGAAYVPIDPNEGPERMRSILDECGARILLAEPDGVRCDPPPACVVLAPDVDATSEPNPRVPCVPGQLAYVLYTSGSSGPPKGVMIEHRNAVALVAWAHGTYSDQELAVVLAGTSVCFDLSIFEMFAPLCAGGSVVLVENALSLPRLPAGNRVTLVNTVPSVMRALLEMDCAFPASLQVVNLAGERLETALVNEVYRRTGAKKVYDLYGPTEATTYSTFKLRSREHPPSIGRPIANTRCYVLDAAGVPAPVGVIGELYLAGDGVARGYLNRPELTAETFVPPPNGHIAEYRLYRTGDLVRYTKTGDLQYCGRLDEQLKVRGFRIEPAEVRSALLAIDGVEDAWILGRQEDAGEVSLAAYVIAATPFSGPALKATLRESLPEHMVPTRIIRVREIPRTINGKVDATRLLELDDSRAEIGVDIAQSDTERQVLGIWKDVLATERIGIHDHFLDLGGHSLTGLRITARVSEALNVPLPPQAMIAHPTIFTMAAEVDRLGAVAAPATLPQLRPGANGAAPTTLVQRHLWLMHRLVKEPLFLNIANSFALRGPFDLAVATHALRGLAERHPILRTKFALRDGALWQEPCADGAVEIRVVDARCEPDTDPERIRRLEAIHAQAAAAFDLDNGPCARFVIARFAADYHVVTMVVHHIAADEWSLGVLGQEFALDYAARISGLTPALSAPTLGFADYASWERQCLAEHRFDGQVDYWRQMLKPPLRRLRLPWRANAAGTLEQIESYPVEIGQPLSAQLAALARREQTSLFVVLLCALKRLLQQRGGDSDIRVATNVALRHQPGVENMIGPLTDTLVLRTDVPSSLAPLVALRRVRESFIAARAQHDVPFEEIVRRVAATAEIKRSSLAPAFFLFDEEPPAMPPFGGLVVEPAAIGAQTEFFKTAVHDYDLILHLTKSAAGIGGQLTLKGQLTSSALPEEILQSYRSLLEELTDDAISS